MREGEQCSYQLLASSWSSDKFIDIEVTLIENTKLMVFEGEDALTSGIANLVTASTGLNQFDSDKAIYLVTEFTGDASSFQFYFRRTSVALGSEDLDSTDELNSDELELKIEKG